ncbi:uncharacterized protein F5Z01DRAFT_634788 [Emericellopsis atlantica]|uniref:MARVEL domain-containing protein n=1 Tax=Emericellopsis atlantica TaxID=2614577 RepID=A0A9P7ZRT8_9HYPO|nr:uncharacterized protein F5Z01DRAFT_634788 [Emericellopsis atlantica]KAG9256473.1 hypothetical protein F5Z01DRAFT_634788 [Emericellopsis atlantica]
MSVPSLPGWLVYLRIAILLVTAGAVGTTAYNASLHHEDWSFLVNDAANIVYFSGALTLAIVTTMLVMEHTSKGGRFYYRLGFVVLLGINSVFWLDCWVWEARLADQVKKVEWLKDWGDRSSSREGDGFFWKRFYVALIASTVMAAVDWLLIITLLAVFVRACLSDALHGEEEDIEMHLRKAADQDTNASSPVRQLEETGSHPEQT